MRQNSGFPPVLVDGLQNGKACRLFENNTELINESRWTQRPGPPKVVLDSGTDASVGARTFRRWILV